MKKKKVVDSLKLRPQMLDFRDAARVRESFSWAFFAKRMKYTAKLVYDDPKVPKASNDAP